MDYLCGQKEVGKKHEGLLCGRKAFTHNIYLFVCVPHGVNMNACSQAAIKNIEDKSWWLVVGYGGYKSFGKLW